MPACGQTGYSPVFSLMLFKKLFSGLVYSGMNQKTNKTKGMFQNLTCRALYEHEIIIFMPVID